MSPVIARVGVTVVGVAAVVGLIAAGSPDVTRARLERSLNEVYPNLYLQQSAILGHGGLTAQTVDAKTTCDRGGPTVADVGAGSDWICHILFTDVAGKRQDGKFEVAAKSNACYVATGPSKLNGPVTITDATTGRDVLNPVFEFDACYDPAG